MSGMGMRQTRLGLHILHVTEVIDLGPRTAAENIIVAVLRSSTSIVR